MNVVFKVFWNNPIEMVTEAEPQQLTFEVPLGAIISNPSYPSFTGNADKVLTVNATEDGVKWTTPLTQVYVDTQDRLLQDKIDLKADATSVSQSLSTKADLVGGLIPASQLPSYVDDVLSFPNLASFPSLGEDAKIYIAEDVNKTYRWSGSSYVEIGGGGVALGETSSTAYRGDRGKIAYDHSLSQGNPHNTTTSEITEGTNRYFTDLRVRDTVLSGLVKTNSSNVTNTDTIEVAVGKLAAKSEAGGSGGTITWVDISTLNGYYKQANISTVNTKIEVAKIGGMLWVRGYITTTNSIGVDTEIFSFADNNYRWDNTFYTTSDYNLILAKTTMHDLDIGYSLTAAQVASGSVHKFALRAGQNYSNTITKALIQPVCVGKHL